MIPVFYNLRSLGARKSTSLASALGIALVVFVLSASRMLVHGLNQAMGRAGSDSHAIVLRKGANAELMSWFTQDLAQQVKAKPGVKRDASGKALAVAELVVVTPLERLGRPDQISSVPVRGIPSDVFTLRRGIKIVEGRRLRVGTDEVMIGKSIRNSYAGISLGKSFILAKQRRATVVGVFEDGGSAFESEIWADIETVRSSYARPALVSSVTVELASAASFAELQQSIEHEKTSAQLSVYRQSDYFTKQSESLAKFVGGLGSVIVFFLAVGAVIGAMITMYAAVQHRSREIGTLRALGFSRFAILSSFVLESSALALFGGLLGTVASLGMGGLELSLTNLKSFSELTFQFSPSFAILLSSLLVGAGMGVVGGFFPAWRAANLSPLDALRE